VERDATPERPRISVVVGEGHGMRRGLLRFVLEGEGFLVIADASSTVGLIQALSVHAPDAIVLDDGLEPTAIILAREMRPDAKLVLVWPRDLAPINGDVTVDPSQVLMDLGPAVDRACGIPVPAPTVATVRSMGSGSRRTERRTAPNGGMGDLLPGPGVPPARPHDDEAVVIDREPAPILILPVTPDVQRDRQS
jgi:hypothetical protein